MVCCDVSVAGDGGYMASGMFKHRGVAASASQLDRGRLARAQAVLCGWHS